MKLKTPYLIALAVSVLIVLWFIYGSLVRDTAKPAPEETAFKGSVPTVTIDRLQSEMHEIYINLHGQTEPDREVSVKAETAGLIVRTPLTEGQHVKRGTIICQQDVDARQALVDQAKAQYRSRELEYTAAQKLVDKGYRSSTQALAAQAALDGARAAVKQTEIELGNVIMRVPFDGIFEQQLAEIGDYLSPGQPCGLLVDLDPLVITGEVTEKQVSLLSIGKFAHIELATGETLSGKIRYVEARANPSTRTFRVEIAVPNKDLSLKAGVSATIKLSAGLTQAHLIPSSVLTLDDQGSIGVRYLDANKTVHFTRVSVIDETSDGVWVLNLPKYTDLIIRGQDFVSEGITVNTQYDINTQDMSGSD
jgi:multidrug efflux system membrane fusion protein